MATKIERQIARDKLIELANEKLDKILEILAKIEAKEKDQK